MNSSINLIAKDTDEIEKKLKRLRLVRIIAISCMSVVVATSVIVFILSSQVPLSSIKKSQDLAISSFTSVKDKAGKLYLEKDRLINVSTLMKKRKNYVYNVELLTNNLSSDLSVEVLTVDNNSMLITVVGSSLDSINTFLDEYVGLANQGKYYKSLNIQSFTLSPSEGNYSLLLRSTLL